MRSWRFVWIVPILVLVLDLYVFQAIKTVSQGASPRMRSAIHTGYWVISIVALLILCFLPWLYRRFTWLQGYAFFILIGFYLAKILVGVFLLLDDVRRVIQWIAGRFLAGSGPAPVASDGGRIPVYIHELVGSWGGCGAVFFAGVWFQQQIPVPGSAGEAGL